MINSPSRHLGPGKLLEYYRLCCILNQSYTGRDSHLLFCSPGTHICQNQYRQSDRILRGIRDPVRGNTSDNAPEAERRLAHIGYLAAKEIEFSGLVCLAQSLSSYRGYEADETGASTWKLQRLNARHRLFWTSRCRITAESPSFGCTTFVVMENICGPGQYSLASVLLTPGHVSPESSSRHMSAQSQQIV